MGLYNVGLRNIQCCNEPAIRTTPPLPVSEAARTVRGGDAESRAHTDQSVDRRTQAPHAAVHQGCAGRRPGRAGELSHHSGLGCAAQIDRLVGGAAFWRETRLRDRSAAGERLARGAVRLCPGQRRFQPPWPPRDHLAESVLSDLRRRGAAGRRPALLPQHPAGKRLQDGLVEGAGRPVGTGATWSTCVRPATPPAR